MGYVFAARYMVPSDVFSTMVVIGAICGLLDLAATDNVTRKGVEADQTERLRLLNCCQL